MTTTKKKATENNKEINEKSLKTNNSIKIFNKSIIVSIKIIRQNP